MTEGAAGSATRQMAILRDAEPLRCPYGHAIPRDAWIPGAAAVRCKQRAPHQAGNQCGAIVLVVGLADGVRAVVEIDHKEAAHIEARRLKPVEIQEYLGLGWPMERRRTH